LSCGPEHGQVVLALHGWLDNAASFVPMMTELASANHPIRFIAPDLVGHGHSYHLPEGMSYGVWEYLPDIKALVDQLNLDQFMLLGHSLGAGISTLFAGAFPRCLKALVLIESIAPLVAQPSHFSAELAQSIKRHQQPTRTPKVYDSMESAVLARAKGKYPVSMANARCLVEQGIKASEHGYIWRHDSRLILPSPVRLIEPQVIACIQKVSVPVLLYRGDQGIQISNLAQRLSTFKQISCYTLKGNHHLHMEQMPAKHIVTALASI